MNQDFYYYTDVSLNYGQYYHAVSLPLPLHLHYI